MTKDRPLAQIINDRSSGGKFYGFVTFANPISATQAIKEMDGKIIDGRVVKVNDARTRGGRPNLNRESFRRDVQRGFASDTDRDHGRNDSNYRHSQRGGHRERSLDYDQDKEIDQSHVRSHDRIKDRYLDAERFMDYDSHMDGVEKELERKREREWERDSGENIEEQRNNIHYKTGVKDKRQDPHLVNRSGFDNYENRELSSESFNDQDQVESKLAISSQNMTTRCPSFQGRKILDFTKFFLGIGVPGRAKELYHQMMPWLVWKKIDGVIHKIAEEVEEYCRCFFVYSRL